MSSLINSRGVKKVFMNIFICTVLREICLILLPHTSQRVPTWTVDFLCFLFFFVLSHLSLKSCSCQFPPRGGASQYQMTVCAAVDAWMNWVSSVKRSNFRSSVSYHSVTVSHWETCLQLIVHCFHIQFAKHIMALQCRKLESWVRFVCCSYVAYILWTLLTQFLRGYSSERGVVKQVWFIRCEWSVGGEAKLNSVMQMWNNAM